MQLSTIPALEIEHIALAYVLGAHNLGCLVRLIGEREIHQATFSDAVQQHGVVIRACHIVIVDRRHEPLVVVWRIGTVGTIVALASGHVTVDLGYRAITLPLRDDRPEAERARLLATGDRVLLRGRPLERAAIADTLVDGELVHPGRLRADLERILRRLNAQ